LQRAPAQVVQCGIRLVERVGLRFGFDASGLGKGKERVPILACEVGHRPDLPFLPEIPVGKGGNIAHVDAAADHATALAQVFQRLGHKCPHRGKDDRRVQRHRCGCRGIAGPFRSHVPGKPLCFGIAVAGKGQDPPPLPSGGPGRNLLIAEAQNPWRYHNALVRVYEQRGNTEALLRLLEHLRDRGQATDRDRLVAGRVALAEDATGDAIEWLEEIQLDQQQMSIELMAIRELAGLYETAEPVARDRLIDLARSALEYQDVDLVLELADKLFAAGAQNEARSCLLLKARRPDVDPADRTRLLGGLIRHQLENGAAFEEIADPLQNLIDGLEPNDLEGAAATASLIAEFGPREKEAWLAFLEAVEKQPDHRVLAGLGIAALQGTLGKVIETTPVGLTSGDDTEANRILAVLTEFGEPGKTAASQFLDQRPRSIVTLFGGDPVRQVQLFGALGDRIRAAKLHARLMRETRSEVFYELRNANRPANLIDRAGVPRAFADAGFPEMAGALFRRYHADLPRLTHEHEDFIADYVRYLIDAEAFTEAETVLAPALQKSIGMEPALLIDLYEAWGRLDETPDLLDKHYLSSGIRVELEEDLVARTTAE